MFNVIASSFGATGVVAVLAPAAGAGVTAWATVAGKKAPDAEENMSKADNDTRGENSIIGVDWVRRIPAGAEGRSGRRVFLRKLQKDATAEERGSSNVDHWIFS